MIMKTIAVEELPIEALGLSARWCQGVPLFNRIDAFLLADYCGEHSIGILGIEGFRIKDQFRIPDMEYIGDFSCLAINAKNDFVKNSVLAAKAFLKIVPKCIWLEFILIATSS